MITFGLAVLVLLGGYALYGTLVERVFGMDPDRPTPALVQNDGVDFVPMRAWKIFLIQFLNIAGLGPVFGAIAGAMWGPAAFLWIAVGSVVAGGVHDYSSGMMSVRMGGRSITEIVGDMLGPWMKQLMRGFTILFMVMVGAVFILGPAAILQGMFNRPAVVFSVVIFCYYLVATVMPVNQVIGRIYPIFGGALLVMAVGILGALLSRGGIPELTMSNQHASPDAFPLFPVMFVSIACGAISGFHSTQSPLMARCLKTERHARPVFYGAMIAEGVVALVWAAAAMSFFGGVPELNAWMADNDNNAARATMTISQGMLGVVGATLAMLGVVAAPISTGDTAFRSARLIVADFVRIDQRRLSGRLLIAVPLFAVGFVLTQVDFGIIWRYFAWANQTLATIVLWAISVFLARQHRFYWLALVPAAFMSMVVITYILTSAEGGALGKGVSLATAAAVTVVFLGLFFRKVRQYLTKASFFGE